MALPVNDKLSGGVKLPNITGSVAPIDAPYVTTAPNAQLPNERVLTAAAGEVTLVDGGPGGPVTVGLANTGVAPGAYTSANITVDAQGRLTAASSGGGGTLDYFEPMAAPAVPNALDLEFDVPSTLTIWDPNSYGTSQSTANSIVTLTIPEAPPGPARLSGAYGALPASGSFQMWTTCSHVRPTAGALFGFFGVAIFGAIPTGATAFYYFSLNDTDPSCYIQTYNNVNSFNSTLAGLDDSTFGRQFVRMRWDASTSRISFDYSADGISWRCIVTTTSSFVGTPTHFAFVSSGSNGIGTTYLRSDFVRFANVADADYLCLGRVV